MHPTNNRAAFHIVWQNTARSVSLMVFGTGLILAVSQWQRWLAIVFFVICCIVTTVDLLQTALALLATGFLAPVKLIVGFSNRKLLTDEMYAFGGVVLRIAEAALACGLVFWIYGQLFHGFPAAHNNEKQAILKQEQNVESPPNVASPPAREAIAGDKRRDAVHRLKPLLDAAAANGDLAAKWRNTPIKNTPPSVFEEIARTSDHILKEGSTIDVNVLNEVYPLLGTMFREKLLGSLRIVATIVHSPVGNSSTQ